VLRRRTSGKEKRMKAVQEQDPMNRQSAVDRIKGRRSVVEPSASERLSPRYANMICADDESRRA